MNRVVASKEDYSRLNDALAYWGDQELHEILDKYIEVEE